ncbi:hypothetical protein TTHERM_00126970 (macronuclear) [Tetrahymena thermophila SB210]|uniref:Uncharacterized protein n=1 Tax=Tetrahymena thermophila (strain SB210) TaxID=312017 RepID=I7MJ74_TETTS|nr:hypothetical protein TTHERM_00126970 [Tetrahymena thermophila SB210]EAR96032.2 hypothetical protein TTHERM_00126970 [Tetrahymena thermophila SB210]|eukprot:XP_001016277.2 hypothetical protein TTHERM_00126970 [Tetrahymena thermophila SB210]
MGDHYYQVYGLNTESGIVEEDDDHNIFLENEDEQHSHQKHNVVVENQINTQSNQKTVKSNTQKKSSNTGSYNTNQLQKQIINDKVDFDQLKLDEQLFYHVMDDDNFDYAKDYFEKNQDQFEVNNIFYSIVLYLLEKIQQIKELKEQKKKYNQTEYIQELNEIYQNINKYINFIQQNLNDDSIKVENISKDLVISLLQSAEYYVDQALMFLDKQSKLRDLLVILLFQCHSEQSIIDKEFNNRIQIFDSKKQHDLEYLQFCLEYLKSLKRIGNVELVRKNLYLLGSPQIQEYHKKFYEENLFQLYDLVIFTNRLPYVLKLMEHGKNFDSRQFIDIQKFENDPRDFIIELNVCLLQKIRDLGYQGPYLTIFFTLIVGQDYESLQEQVKKNFSTDIITKIEKKEKKANKQIYLFTEKEYQILKPFTVKYFKDIKALSQEYLPIPSEIPYLEQQDKSNYFDFLMTLKRCGQYENVVHLIDYGPILRDIDFVDQDYLTLFKFLTLQQNNEPIYTSSDSLQNTYKAYSQIQEKLPIILKSLSSNKNYKLDIEFTSKHSYKRIFKNLFIFYNRAMCLVYLKFYQESYETLLIIIAVIIKLEGSYSYNLLPSLSLLSEVSSYLQQKTLSHQCLIYKQIILNDISQSDSDIQISDIDQLID